VSLSRQDGISAAELACLLGLGLLAAIAELYVRPRLGLPGHAVLRTVLPFALGLALVPRQLAGSMMGATAFLTVVGLQRVGGPEVGLAAQTSLLATGPLLDLAAVGARPGWWLYARLTLAGLAANLLALGTRIGLVELGLALPPGGQAERLGWAGVAASYAAFGLAAGLVSAICWFRLRAGHRPEGQ
jgi:hypothetical protein